MNPKLLLTPAVPFCVLFLAGCTSVQFAPSQVAQNYTQRTPPEKIELFRSQTPAKKYSEIGAVNACCSSDANAMIDLLRSEASQYGGDALIGLEMGTRGEVSASVIRYQ